MLIFVFAFGIGTDVIELTARSVNHIFVCFNLFDYFNEPPNGPFLSGGVFLPNPIKNIIPTIRIITKYFSGIYIDLIVFLNTFYKLALLA